MRLCNELAGTLSCACHTGQQLIHDTLITITAWAAAALIWRRSTCVVLILIILIRGLFKYDFTAFAWINYSKARTGCLTGLSEKSLHCSCNWKLLNWEITVKHGGGMAAERSETSAWIINVERCLVLSDSFYKWSEAFCWSQPNGVN